MLGQLFLALTTLALFGQSFRLYPLPLKTWQNAWVQNSVEISRTNIATTGVSATFYVNPSTAITKGYVDIVFPTGFTVSGAGCDVAIHSGCTATVSGQTVTLRGITLSAGSDARLGVTNVKNPDNAGGYGPFVLTTRYFPEGQIVDINRTFGAVGISAAPSNISGLTVDLAGTNANYATGAQNGVLSVKFVTALDLWKYDVFAITFDKYWTVAQQRTIECRSVDYTGKTNVINGTRANDKHQLDCAVSNKDTETTAQVVYIYGLANDVDISLSDDYKYIELQVGPVTNPSVDYPVSTYSWNIDIYRFQTRNTIQTGVYTNGPLTTPSPIRSVTYTPSWGFDISGIVRNMKILMDVSVTGTNPLPANGEIVITFAETVNVAWVGTTTCFLLQSLTGVSGGTTYTASCASSAAKDIKISTVPPISFANSIKFRVYATFDSGSPIMGVKGVTTYQSAGGLKIDEQAGDLTPIKLDVPAIIGDLAQAFEILLKNEVGGATLNQAGGDRAGQYLTYFKVKWQPTTGTNADQTSKVQVTCPISSDTHNDYQFYFPQSGSFKAKSRKDNEDLSGGAVMDGLAGRMALPTLSGTDSSELGTLTWNLNPTAANIPASGEYQVVGLYRDAGDQLGLPKVASNQTTRYECRLVVTSTESTGPHQPFKAATLVTIANREWKAAPTSANILGQRYQPGVIQKTVFQPDRIAIPANESTKAYYIEFEYLTNGAAAANKQTAMLGSGLSSGDTFPLVCETALTTTLKTTTLVDATEDAIRIGTFSKFDDTAAATCFYPVGSTASDANGTVSLTVRAFFQDVNDTRIKQIYYEQAAAVTAHNTVSTAWTGATLGTGIASSVAGSTIQTFDLSIKSASDAALNEYVQVVFPTGMQISPNSSLSIGGTLLIEVHRFTSPNRSFVYPTIYGKCSVAGCQPLNGTAKTLRVTNVTTRTGAVNGTVRLYLGAAGANMRSVSTQTFTTTSGSIYLEEIDPQSFAGRGPKSIDLPVRIVFTTQHGVPAGGSIILTIANDWGITTNSSCTVSGVSIVTGQTAISCVRSVNQCTVTNFADFDGDPTKKIEITITKLLPPVNAGNVTTKEIIASLQTKDENSNVIDNYTNTAADDVSVTTEFSDGQSFVSSFTTVPPNAAAFPADLLLKFTLSNSIPENGQIQINLPVTTTASQSNIKDICWLKNLKYKACTSSSKQVFLTIGEQYTSGKELELKVEKFINNPVEATTTSDGARFTSTWEGETIDNDPAIIRTDQLLTVGPKLTSFIENDLTIVEKNETKKITFTPWNAWETATYYFSLQSSAEFAITDQLQIRFPDQFDPFLGQSQIMYTQHSSTYYLKCKSKALGDSVFCTVFHNVVIISGAAAVVSATTTIDVELIGIYNPAAGETGQFFVAQLNASGDYIAFINDFGTVTITSVAPPLIVRSVELSSYEIFATGVTHTFKFYPATAVDSGKTVKALFPRQYDLTTVSAVTSYTCSTTYVSDAVDETVGSVVNWNNASNCSVAGNTVTLPAPATHAAFKATDLVTWTVSGVTNPEWGDKRTYQRSYWDWDSVDTDVWAAQEAWSSNFELFVFDENLSSKIYTARTYGVLSASYIGLVKSSRYLTVNEYDPQFNTKRIQVYAGTETNDIAISVEDLNQAVSAARLKLTPSTNKQTPDGGLLSYRSVVDDFTLFLGQQSIKFRLAAGMELAKGLYYIDWALIEESVITDDDYWYYPPCKTLVEVIPKAPGLLTLSIAQLSSAIPLGTTSLPIKIEAPYGPEQDVAVMITVTDGSTTGISLSPAKVEFGKGEREKYFQIVVDTTYDLSTVRKQTVTLALSGTNAEIYKIQEFYEFELTESNETSSDGVKSWGLQTCEKNSCKLKPELYDVGVLYYQISYLGSACRTYDQLKAEADLLKVTDTTSDDTVGTTQQKLASDHSYILNNPKTEETWSEFQYRALKHHAGQYWVGSIAITSLNEEYEIEPNWLWASTQYQICGYVENVYDKVSAVSTERFATAAGHDAVQWSVTLTGDVDEIYETAIRNVLGYWQGVHPDRHVFVKNVYTYGPVDGHYVRTHTTFYFNLVAERQNGDPKPSVQVTVDPTLYGKISTHLSKQLAATVTDIRLEGEVPRYRSYWVNPPTAPRSVSTSAMTFSVEVSEAGQTCCVAVFGTLTTGPITEQVFIGLDHTNAEAPHQCIQSTPNEPQDLTLNGLEPDTTYTVFCTPVDSYPLWPTYIYAEGSTTFNGVNTRTESQVNAQTAESETEDDFAKMVAVAWLALLAAVLN